MSVTDFQTAYIEAALWSSTDDDGEPLDDGRELATETRDRMLRDARMFYNERCDLFANDDKQAGHDFWLTRNGHGAGFWDGDWPEPLGKTLTNASQAYGEFNLYIGDDGLIYGM